MRRDHISQSFDPGNISDSVPASEDKWNPADMWMVDPSLVNMDFGHFDSIHMLNSYLYDQYTKKKIIGVSLKQARGSAKAEIFNYRLAC